MLNSLKPLPKGKDMTNAIEISGLTKRFGPILAVDHVSFSVTQGEVLGFLGPNGAGKSTSMKMITGFLRPDAGRSQICGHDMDSDPLAAKRKIGYLPEGAPAYGDMTPASYLKFIADARGLTGAKRAQGLEDAIARSHLEHVLYQPIETLSKGFKRRVGLAQAILHNPPVLVLDEPTDGLDPNQKHEVRQMIRDMAAEKCIIISTHILEEVNAICSRALIIAKGKIVADGTPHDLETRSPYHNAVTVVTAPQALEDMVALLKALPDVATLDIEDQPDSHGCVKVTAFPQEDRMIINQISAALQGCELPVREMTVERGRLEDVFRQVTLPDAHNAA